jgi:hypothetical protein
VKASESGGQGIYIRGQKSVEGDTEALYVVDGMMMHDISFIIPCEISSINILKDGGAAIQVPGRKRSW